MILSDRDIRARLQESSLVIEPLDDPALQIQPASVDLRLAPNFATYKTNNMDSIDTRDLNSFEERVDRITVDTDQGFVLQPGDFALGATMEYVRIPKDLVARVEGRSSIGRLAIVVHATAGFIDPGFEGQITLELSNLGRCPVRLYPGMRISQLVFHTMTSPAEHPYGSPERSSKYQGQRGPIPSRIYKDSDSNS